MTGIVIFLMTVTILFMTGIAIRLLLMTVIIKGTIRTKAFIKTPLFVTGIAVMFMTGITVIVIIKGSASRTTQAFALLT